MQRRHFSYLRLLAAVFALMLLSSVMALARAHEGMDHGVPGATLGTVVLENSCRRDVQASLNRAVALLHSFWLAEARSAFTAVTDRDPDCAMAYWGMALAGLHQINGEPSAEEIMAGNAVLLRAATAREQTAREAAYLAALRAFYEGYKPADYFARAQAYVLRMEQLVAAYPRDVEARAFLALGLLAAAEPADVTLEKPRRAVALLSPLLATHPRHPGIAHYLIHACDNPQMARQGLAAARSYALIAPAAPHALHMPSHIFARLGLWQEDIRSNLASITAAENPAHPASAENRLHAMEFLEYAYLQRGQDTLAARIVQEAATVRSADVDPAYPDYYGDVQARLPMLLALETGSWQQAAELVPDVSAGTHAQGLTLLARAIAAGHLHDPAAARAAQESYEALLAGATIVRPGGGLDTLRQEIRAWSELAQGHTDAALALLQPVSERQDRVGKGEVELPAGEMRADMLLVAGRAHEALAAYQQSLKIDPGRLNALLGAGRAAEQSSLPAVARRYYVAALAQTDGSTPKRLESARAFLQQTSR
jgi:hypothetical protein